MNFVVDLLFTQFSKETGIGCAFWRWADEVESVQGATDRAHPDERSGMVDVGKLIDRVERMEANVVGRLEYKINLMIAVILFFVDFDFDNFLFRLLVFLILICSVVVVVVVVVVVGGGGGGGGGEVRSFVRSFVRPSGRLAFSV